MVFCNYIENTEKKVKYAYGATEKDITGEFIYNFKDKELEIVKEPENEDAPIRHLYRLLRMHQNEFEKGIFKPKIYYATA